MVDTRPKDVLFGVVIDEFNKQDSPMTLSRIRETINSCVIADKDKNPTSVVQFFEWLAGEIAQGDETFEFNPESVQFAINETLIWRTRNG